MLAQHHRIHLHLDLPSFIVLEKRWMMYDLSVFGLVCVILRSRTPLASPKIKCPNCPPSHPDSLANHQSLSRRAQFPSVTF